MEIRKKQDLKGIKLHTINTQNTKQLAQKSYNLSQINLLKRTNF
jgi:hypothetical protein